MHELSLAEAAVDLVREQIPADAVVLSVRMEAGAMRAIVPEAMQFGWQAATENTAMAGSRLDLFIEPWKLECPECGRTYESDDMFTPCQCGCVTPVPHGSNHLRISSVEIADEPATETADTK